MNSKKLISCICAAALICSAASPIEYCTLTASAYSVNETISKDNSEIFTSGDYEYRLSQDGNAVITKYNGTDSVVEVPDILDGKKVTAVGHVIIDSIYTGAFSENPTIEKVILPDTINEIESVAFLSCQNLKTVILPDSLQKIGGGAFAGTALENIEFPSSLEVIPDHCFTGCPFTELEITDGVKKIENSAFWQCDKLTKVSFPASLENLGENAFDGCTSLKDAYFFGDNTVINPYAFSDREGNHGDITIHGRLGSNAEKFANEYGFKFEDLDSVFGDFKYNISDNGEVTITEYFGTDKEVTIPSEIDGKKVTVIGSEPSIELMQGAFTGNLSLQKVIIPDTVTKIEALTFLDCENLRDVNLPDTLTEIGAGAFANCSLETLKIPSKLTAINSHTFAQNDFKEVIIPDNVKAIRESAFWQCTKLSEINIPKSVETIEQEAFTGCTSLTDIIIENPNTTIAPNTFTDREGNSIDVTIHGYTNSTAQVFASEYDFKFVPIDGSPLPPPIDVITQGDFDFLPFDDVLILIGYNGSDKDVVVPAELDGKLVVTIGEESFKDNENVEKVTLPKTIIHIGPNAFLGCKNLKTADIPEKVEDIGGGAFARCTSLTDFTLNNPETSIDPTAFTDSNGTKLKDVIVHGKKGSTAEKIANEYGFNFVSDDEQTNIKDTLTSGDYEYTVNDDGTVTIYKYNGSDREVTIPPEIDGKKVTVIGSVVSDKIMQGAFSGSKNLEKVTIPDGLTEIETVAFLDCENLKAVDLPDSITKIGGGAFAGTSLESIQFPKNLEVIPDHGFTGCKFKSIEIPEGIKKIEQSAFWNCEELTEIIFPESLEEIAENAFDGCTSLKNAVFKNPNTKIDINAFSDWDGNPINVTIHGKDDSTAKDFAEKNSLNFKPITPDTKAIYGDIDNDGNLTSYDSLLILRQSVGLESFTPEQIKAADVDKDGHITSNDSLIVLRASVGLKDQGSTAGQAITE